jgi:hypothetical protein
MLPEDVKKLREDYPNSYFFNPEYDGAITGVSDDKRIIYDETELIGITCEWNKEDYIGDDYEKDAQEGGDTWNDYWDQNSNVVYDMIREAEDEELPPIVTGLDDDDDDEE